MSLYSLYVSILTLRSYTHSTYLYSLYVSILTRYAQHHNHWPAASLLAPFRPGDAWGVRGWGGGWAGSAWWGPGGPDPGGWWLAWQPCPRWSCPAASGTRASDDWEGLHLWVNSKTKEWLLPTAQAPSSGSGFCPCQEWKGEMSWMQTNNRN